MNKDHKLTVLYVDDERVNLLAFQANFRRDFNVLLAESADKALAIMEDSSPEVVIADQRMPEQTGVEFFGKISSTHPDSIRILLTGFSDVNDVIDAINLGKVFSYVTKPWQEDELRRTIENARKTFMLKRKNDITLRRYSTIRELSSDGLLSIKENGTLLDVNPAFMKQLGYTDKNQIMSKKADQVLINFQELFSHFQISDNRKQSAIFQDSNGSEQQLEVYCIGEIKEQTGEKGIELMTKAMP